MGCDENISPISSDLPISIHASRMGCDIEQQPISAFREFQSTHPVWDATRSARPLPRRSYFNPRIPYGMRPPARIMAWCSTNFNPRIPYGMRRHVSADPAAAAYFNPRIPYGMRLIFLSLASVSCRYFNPRIPYGMRQIRKVKMLVLREFQSTHPVWDATLMLLETVHGIIISIHASRMGCDPIGERTS